MGDTVSVRMLILKHSPEDSAMSNRDADLAIDAVDSAKAKGLDIQVIGNYFCTDRAGVKFAHQCPIFQGPKRTQPRFESPRNAEFNEILRSAESEKYSKLKDFVVDHMKLNAKANDTLLLFSIGHGSPDGYLANIGSRRDVLQSFTDAAKEAKQRVLWWSLSCYGCAGLPEVPSELAPMFSIVTSSAADYESSEGVQGRIMDEVFQSIISKDKSLDDDGNGLITGKEVKSYFRNANIPHDGGGPIAHSQDATCIFGYDGDISWDI